MALIPDGRPVWEVDGRDWPNRGLSRFVEAGGLRWHVQVGGAGPVLLLAHGTGAATHSWARLLPLLAARFTVVAPDLPGHGFTAMPPPRRMSLTGMGDGLAALLAALDLHPSVAIGHSAGAAILCRMAIDRAVTPGLLVAINGALLPFRGMAGNLFGPLARLAAGTSLWPQLFSWHARADRHMVRRLIRDTGSRIGGVELEMYERLARRPGHVGAALAMMAHWHLGVLRRDLPRLPVPLALLVGTRDRAVRPAEAGQVQSILPSARLVELPGLGHLAHEEDPGAVGEAILALAKFCVR